VREPIAIAQSVGRAAASAVSCVMKPRESRYLPVCAEAGPGNWIKLAAVAVFIVLAAWAANRQR
jgi:hypothetical protein